MTEAHKIETLLSLTRDHLDIMLRAKAEGKVVDKQITQDCLDIEKYEALLSEAK